MKQRHADSPPGTDQDIRYVIAFERMRDCLGELVPLHRAHWDELDASWRPDTVFAPDYTYYLRREEQGGLYLVTARETASNRLVGYLKIVFTPDLHDRSSLVCDEHGLYVVPAHRSFRLVKRMMDMAEELWLRSEVPVLRVTGPPDDRFARFLTRRGYEPVRVVYAKVR